MRALVRVEADPVLPLPRLRSLAPYLFVASVGALLLAALFSAALIGRAEQPWGGRKLLHEENGWKMLVVEVPVEPGDTLRVPGVNVNGGEGVEVYVVEDGEAEALLRNETPAHVLAHRPAPARLGFDLVRPAPPAGTPEGAAAPVVQIAYLQRYDPADHDDDVVGSFHREMGDEWIDRGQVRPYVLDGDVLSLLPWMRAARWTLLGAVAATGVLWLVARRPAVPEPAAEGSEALLRLAMQAEGYLKSLRTVLHLTGALLVILFLPAITAVSLIMTSRQSPSWQEEIVVENTFIFAYAMVGVVWLRHYLDVRRELKRVRAMTAKPPLGL